MLIILAIHDHKSQTNNQRTISRKTIGSFLPVYPGELSTPYNPSQKYDFSGEKPIKIPVKIHTCYLNILDPQSGHITVV